MEAGRRRSDILLPKEAPLLAWQPSIKRELKVKKRKKRKKMKKKERKEKSINGDSTQGERGFCTPYQHTSLWVMHRRVELPTQVSDFENQQYLYSGES